MLSYEQCQTVMCLGMLSLFSLAFLWQVYIRYRLAQEWQVSARRLGLTCEQEWFLAYPQLSGEYRGRGVNVFPYKISRSDHITRIEVQVRDTLVAMNLWNGRHTDELERELGWPSKIQTGVADFDEAFWLSGEPEAQIRDAFQDASLRALLVKSNLSYLVLQKGVLEHELEGLEGDPDTLEALLVLMAKVAENMDRAGEIQAERDRMVVS